MLRKIIIILTIGAVLLIGCAPTTSKVEFSTDQVCKDIVLFKTSLKVLEDMEATATPKELDAQFDVVHRNFMNLTQSVANLAGVEISAVEDAINNLTEARAALPEDATTLQILESLSDEIKAVNDAVDKVTVALQCGE